MKRRFLLLIAICLSPGSVIPGQEIDYNGDGCACTLKQKCKSGIIKPVPPGQRECRGDSFYCCSSIKGNENSDCICKQFCNAKFGEVEIQGRCSFGERMCCPPGSVGNNNNGNNIVLGSCRCTHPSNCKTYNGQKIADGGYCEQGSVYCCKLKNGWDWRASGPNCRKKKNAVPTA